MDAYRGIPNLLDRCQVGPSANVLLVVRAWEETGFAGTTFDTAWGDACTERSTWGTGQEGSACTQGDNHLLWFHAEGGGLGGKTVLAAYGQYICIQVKKPLSFCERSFRIGKLHNTEYSSRVWLPCRRVHFAC